MEQTQRKLGGNIAALRRAKGLTQEQLAGLLGVSAPAVSKWETGASYPDITLLCPLARALDTNVDRLLQFEPDLSRSAVHEKIQEVIQFARGEAERQAGPDASLALLRSLLRQYPNSLELKLNGAAVLDAFWLIFPEAGPGCREQWQEEKQALLEAVWTGGDPIQRQTAALQLTSLALSTDKLEQAHTLLQELPKPVGDATMLWVQYKEREAGGSQNKGPGKAIPVAGANAVLPDPIDQFQIHAPAGDLQGRGRLPCHSPHLWAAGCGGWVADGPASGAGPP